MAHAHFMLDTKGYTHTLRTCNTYCFSTATIVARTRLNLTLCVHCLSYFYRLCIEQDRDMEQCCHRVKLMLTVNTDMNTNYINFECNLKFSLCDVEIRTNFIKAVRISKQ